ncbi:MAG: VWA domain-containing protein [Bacteroidia bacterium]
MFRLEHKEYLMAFGLLPFMALVFIIVMINKKRLLAKLGDYPLVKAMIPDVSRGKQIAKFILFTLGFGFLIFGICNLQTGSKMQEVKREGGDIMICLDVSNSMLAEDLNPNRLERAKQAIEKFIEKLEGDRVGIIIFAGEAYVQLPITSDYSAAKLFLNGINTNIVPTQGTAVGAALEKAIESFGKDVGKNKAIVVITDGENHEDDAVKIAEDAAKQGVSINTIGIGSDEGVPIPYYQNGVKSGFRKDKDGNTVVTKLNETLLKEIASAGNGVYIKASNSDVGLNSILDQLKELDRKQIESKMYTDYEDQFQWFIGASLLLLTIEFLFSERISRWWKKLNLFENGAQ